MMIGWLITVFLAPGPSPETQQKQCRVTPQCSFAEALLYSNLISGIGLEANNRGNNHLLLMKTLSIPLRQDLQDILA